MNVHKIMLRRGEVLGILVITLLLTSIVTPRLTKAQGTGPAISNITASSTNDGTGATVMWNTDIPTNSQIEYGTTTNYGTFSPLSDAAVPVTSHLLTLSGLIPATLYHFAVLGNATSTVGTTTQTMSTTSLDQILITNSSGTTRASGAPPYCNTTAATQGYYVSTDQTSYPQGQTTHVCLLDNTRTPLFLQGTHPWQITDQNGNVVFTPAAGTLITNPQATGFFTDSWNGMNASSTPVSPGTYKIVFPGFPGTPSASFMITGTSTATSTTGTSSVNALIAQLQTLQGIYPTFTGQIQALINVLLGNGTTVGNTAPATVDQNGGTFSAGSTIDFGGRNFGHEENVTITLNGKTVATPHADGGGNFTTGSLSLPTTPGTYTYVFTGQNSGIVVDATVYLH